MDRLIEALMREESKVVINDIEIDLKTYQLKTLKCYPRKREKEAVKVAEKIMELIEN
ncbi:MAG: hypothetical protein KDH96_05185 [Candidatus Riesia sp.]|nr:hypothetical protein [Candidatus Riesia sp.]